MKIARLMTYIGQTDRKILSILQADSRIANVADTTAYRRFLGERLLALPGVRETRTYAVKEEVKRDVPLPVG